VGSLYPPAKIRSGKKRVMCVLSHEVKFGEMLDEERIELNQDSTTFGCIHWTDA
jgi:hypothetical protein